MPRKLPVETIELIEQLYADDLHIKEIARRAKVSYATAYSYTRLKQRINPVTGEPFETAIEYKKYCAMQKINPETNVNYTSLFEYEQYRAKQRTIPGKNENFKSRRHYVNYLARQRQKRAVNQALSELIQEKLDELGKNQKWLAQKLGVAKQTVSLYVAGKSLPSKPVLHTLSLALDVQYQTLDDLVR